MDLKNRTVVTKDQMAVVDLQIHHLAARMNMIRNETHMIYLWKWFPPCHGLRGVALVKYLQQNGCTFDTPDVKNNQISGESEITYVFYNKRTKEKRAAVLTFRAVKKAENTDEMMLEHGHREIPFPEDIQIIEPA